MAWLLVEIWRTLQDAWKARQEKEWQDKLIDLDAEKKVSRIRATLTKSESRLTKTEAELQKVKADYIWSKVPTEEGDRDGSSGTGEKSTRETKTS